MQHDTVSNVEECLLGDCQIKQEIPNQETIDLDLVNTHGFNVKKEKIYSTIMIKDELIINDVEVKEEREDRSGLLKYKTEHSIVESYDTDIGNSTLHQENLTPPIAVNGKVKYFECGFCKQTFACLQKLNDHIRNHTGDKPFECDTCHKAFYSKGTLNTHLVIHKDSKPFKCHACTKTFYRRSDLTRHGQVHTGDRPHKCETCGKRLSCLKTFKAHVRIHTGDSPYECDTCHKRFGSKWDLARHATKCDKGSSRLSI